MLGELVLAVFAPTTPPSCGGLVLSVPDSPRTAVPLAAVVLTSKAGDEADVALYGNVNDPPPPDPFDAEVMRPLVSTVTVAFVYVPAVTPVVVRVGSG
jgi:hypothetical protein